MEAIVVIITLVIIAVIALVSVRSGKKSDGTSTPGGTDSPGDIKPLDPNVKPE